MTTYEITPDNNPEVWDRLQSYLPEHASHLDRVHDGYCYQCQIWIEPEEDFKGWDVSFGA